jgi:hypothetical protein
MRKLIKERPKIGDERIRTTFLLFPKTLTNPDNKKFEKRWLEKVRIIEQYYNAGIDNGSGWSDNRWASDVTNMNKIK